MSAEDQRAAAGVAVEDREARFPGRDLVAVQGGFQVGQEALDGAVQGVADEDGAFPARVDADADVAG